MEDRVPKHVICAVRAGPESRNTVTRAVDMALEMGARLTFVLVMDVGFLEHATVGPVRVVYRELVEMGQFALAILCDRARRRGVEHVEGVVMEGDIRRQLRQLATETQADLVVMGLPTRSYTRNVFRFDEIDGFVAELEQEGQLQVVLVAPDPRDGEQV